MESELTTNLKMQVNVMLPVTFVHSIDKVRGNVARAEFIRNFLLKNESKILKAG